MTIELLQEVGLSKYEAEAYYALLRHGPLTGYELGKRSAVPLSRSYEILERLLARGLALLQPGDPPRYAAEPPEQFLERSRAATTATFDALARDFAELAQTGHPGGFWVARGRAPILATARSLVERAQSALAVGIASAHAAALDEAVEAARARGCHLVRRQLDQRLDEAAALLVVCDEREGLVGTLSPADECQAVLGTSPAFVAALGRMVAGRSVFVSPFGVTAGTRPDEARQLDWLDWENRKQRGLLESTA